MARRAVRAGETIRLRTRFKDDLGDPAEAGSVYVHVFEPEEEDFELVDAHTVSGVPTYLGEGIFEYEFTVPGTGPDGIWYDAWQGTLTGQSLTAILSFEVSASGVISELPETQLYTNDVVGVTIASGIQATDGSSLESSHEFEFMTTISPGYTNIRKVLLRTGSFLTSLEYDVLQTAILEASIEADTLTFSRTQVNLNVFRHARREFVTCLASSMLLNNLANGSLKAKTLGDLHVEYNTQGLMDTLQGIEDCMSRWEPQIMAGGGAKAKQNPKMVVKGEYDPDRPAVSRMWQSTDEGSVSRRIPAANTREQLTGQRRHLRTYRKRRW